MQPGSWQLVNSGSNFFSNCFTTGRRGSLLIECSYTPLHIQLLLIECSYTPAQLHLIECSYTPAHPVTTLTAATHLKIPLLRHVYTPSTVGLTSCPRTVISHPDIVELNAAHCYLYVPWTRDMPCCSSSGLLTSYVPLLTTCSLLAPHTGLDHPVCLC